MLNSFFTSLCCSPYALRGREALAVSQVMPTRLNKHIVLLDPLVLSLPFILSNSGSSLLNRTSGGGGGVDTDSCLETVGQMGASDGGKT